MPAIVVRAIRREAFVEFEYSLDAGALAVELILPIDAFYEFSQSSAATVTSDDPKVLANLYTLRQQQRLRAMS